MEAQRRIRLQFGLLIVGATFGALLGFVATRSINFRNFASDYTPPHLQQVPSGSAEVLIEAGVDSRGRISDYRVISNAEGAKDLPPRIKNLLIFTTFRPATYMDRPIASTAVLSFPKMFVEER